MMNWLSPPTDFRGDLQAASTEPQTGRRLERLSALAGQRLDFLQVAQLSEVLSRTPAKGDAGFPSVQMAILASATVNHLVPGIKVALLRRRLLCDVYVAAYGQVRQTLLDRASPLYQNPPDFLLLSLAAQEAVSGLALTLTTAKAETVVRHAVDELRALWRVARDQLRTVVIQQTFLNVAEPLFGSYERAVPGAPASIIARMNDQIAQAAVEDGVLILDVARASERDGLDAWFDSTRWLHGKMEIAPRMGPMFGELLSRIIGAQRGLSKKCLVLDLDNTLWGGVIGDDGLDGIVLGEGSGVGEAHLALQRYTKRLHDRGVILAVCSKNDPLIAETAFREHPEMLLRRSDVAAFVANWEDKASNLVRIAEQLNLGVDSFVFIDDNPAERARVRQSLPTVAVPELPDDVGQWVRCIADAGYFEALMFTNEDSQRGQQYAENSSRDAFRESASSLEAFLKSLDMCVTFGSFESVDVQRITQLIGKTNQFNLTTRRYAAPEIDALVGVNNCLALQFRLADRFGDNGIVSAMILRPSPDEDRVLEIDTWVMSCRVFGRQLEQMAMNIAVDAARRRGIRAIRGQYIPTARNDVVRELYPTLGFMQISGIAANAGTTWWSVDVAGYVPCVTHIKPAGHP
jgi:FkbH-like protein